MSRLNTLAPSPPLGSQTNLRESGDLRSQGKWGHVTATPSLSRTGLRPQNLPPPPGPEWD